MDCRETLSYGISTYPKRHAHQNFKSETATTALQNVWFMHDSAPAHFAIVIRSYNHDTYPGKWVGCSGPVGWPPRAPDLNPLNFLFYDLPKIACA
ncbi:hypothetical protein TNCV_97841 [Trichonephila clavipes]|nr:hypothetical protein TNCV_97841 [Trichonephila clavipes]